MIHVGRNHWFALFLTVVGCVNIWYITVLCKKPPSNIIFITPNVNELYGLGFGMCIWFLVWLKKIHLLRGIR